MSVQLYAVYKDGEIQSSGSLLDCWRWLMTVYGDQFSATGLVGKNYILAHDLADSGVYIAPVVAA